MLNVVNSGTKREYILDHDDTGTARKLFDAASGVAARRKRGMTNTDSVIVSGEVLIKKIILEYSRSPEVIFLSDDEKTPDWIENLKSGIYIVKCQHSLIRKHLISDAGGGIAAVFLTHSSSVVQVCENFQEHSPIDDEKCRRVLFMHGIHLSVNAGLLVYSGLKNAFRTVVLHKCVLPFSERFIRHSNAAIFHPAMKIYQLGSLENEKVIRFLCGLNNERIGKSQIILGMPDKGLHTVQQFANSFGQYNFLDRCILCLGGEHHGFSDLLPHFPKETQKLTIPIDSMYVESLNVTAAGTILMDSINAFLMKPSKI